MPSLEEIANDVNTGDDIDVDFSGEEDYEAVPDGTWAAVLADVEADVSNAGNPVIKWTFQLENGQDGLTGTNRQMTRSTVTKGKGSGLTKKTLKQLGVTVEQGQDKVAVKPSQLKGTPVWLTVGQQKKNPEYQEIKVIKVRDIDPLAN